MSITPVRYTRTDVRCLALILATGSRLTETERLDGMPVPPVGASGRLKTLASESEHERIRRMLSGSEPDVGKFLVVPREGQLYAEGTVVPLLGQTARPSESGSLRLSSAEPVEHDYFGTFIVLTDYLDRPRDLAAAIQGLADGVPREKLIAALAGLNMHQRLHGGPTAILEYFRACVAPEVRVRLDSAMNVAAGGLGRLIVGPQPLLLAMRWLMGRPPISEPLKSDVAPEAAAILFSHAIGSTIQEPRHDDTPLSIDEQKRLMLTMMNLGMLGEHQDIYSSIDRTTRLWREYGAIAQEGLGATAVDLLVEATGLEPEDFLAVGFLLLAHSLAWRPGSPVALARQLYDEMPPEVREVSLRLMSQSLDTSMNELGDPLSEFDLLAIEARPILETTDGLIILDQDLLWKRCTSGLFWFVHDWLREERGERVAQEWRKTHGTMVEALTEDSLRPLAPPDFSGALTFYTEDDFEHAYGQVARCDVGIDFGEELLLVEVVSGQLTVRARVEADLAKLDADFDRLVIDKCRQLDSTSKNLLFDEEPLTGVPKGRRTARIVPALVIGGGLQLNALSYGYIRWRLEELGLLNDPRVGPLAILDLEDVETLEALGEMGRTPTDVLTHWQESDMRNLPLHNFLIRHGYASDGRRPSRMKQTVDAAYNEIFRRVGMPPPPTDETGSIN